MVILVGQIIFIIYMIITTFLQCMLFLFSFYFIEGVINSNLPETKEGDEPIFDVIFT